MRLQSFVLLGLFCASGVAAQAQGDSSSIIADPRKVTLAGVVKDEQGRLLAATEIIADETHRAITDAKGEFTISGLNPGTIGFTARRIGYNPVNKAVKVDPGLIVHLAVTLVPVAVELGTIVVEGKRFDKSLMESGFYRRRDAGLGHYFDDEFFKHHQAALSSLLTNLPSVFIQRRRDGAAAAMRRTAEGGLCPLSVFVDGNLITWATYTGIDDVVNRDDVLAMEVYSRPSEIPTKYAGIAGMARPTGQGFTECGAILIWTKPMGARR